MTGFAIGFMQGGLRSGDSTPAPAWTLQRLVIEGDSITSNDPSTYSSTFYSYRYDDSRPDLFVEVRADGSRTVGYAADGDALNDDGNTFLGNVAEDMAYSPDLITWFIGANDITNTRTAQQHMDGMIAVRGHYAAARPQCRVAWSPPLPYNASGTPHPTYTQFTNNRAALFAANPRNPATWGQWADYYIPMGEHPDFADVAQHPTLFSDGVHPSAAGQTKLLDVYAAAVDSMADSARASSSTMYGSAWPSSETNLTADTPITRRILVSGIAHTGLALGASVSGGGAEIRLNGGAWTNEVGTGSGNGFRIYNGDIIDLRLTTSAVPTGTVSVDLRIGSETRTLTYQTVAAVDPVSYQYIDHYIEPNPFTSRTFNVEVAQAGHLLIAAHTDAVGATISIDGGAAVASVFRQERAATVAMDFYVIAVTPGTKVVTITYPASKSRHCIAYGLLLNADPVPVQSVGIATANQSSPHSTPAFSTPANGLAMAFYLAEGSGQATTPPTCNNPTEFVAHDYALYQSAYRGITVGKQTANGPAIFAYVFGTFARAAIVFKAQGT